MLISLNVTTNVVKQNGPTTLAMTITARVSSLKSVYVVMTDKHNGALTYFTNASAQFGLSEYYFRIGSEIFPAKRPSTTSEFFAELCKALGSLGDLSSQGLVNSKTFLNSLSAYNQLTVPNDVIAATVGVATKEQCFMVGFEAETYGNANKDAIYAGFNTLTSDIQFCSTHDDDGISADTNVKFTCFALRSESGQSKNEIRSQYSE